MSNLFNSRVSDSEGDAGHAVHRRDRSRRRSQEGGPRSPDCAPSVPTYGFGVDAVVTVVVAVSLLLLNLGVAGCAFADEPSPMMGRSGWWVSVLMFGALCSTLAFLYFRWADLPVLMVGAGASGALMTLWFGQTVAETVAARYGRGRPT